MAYAMVVDGIKLETYATEEEAYEALDFAVRADTEVVEVHDFFGEVSEYYGECGPIDWHEEN